MTTIVYEVGDRVAWLTINRPEARNALNKVGARRPAGRASERFADDADADVLILTGAGDKAFCAGGDLKEMADTALRVPPPDFLLYLQRTRQDRQAGDRRGQRRRVRRRLPARADGRPRASPPITRGSRSPRPKVGPRVAVGRAAALADPAARRAGAAAHRRSRSSAQRAYELGLVNRVVPARRAARRGRRRMAARHRRQRAAVGARRQGSWSTSPPSRAGAAALDAADELYEPVYLSEDGQEGPRAFREKRAPRWQGR